MEKYRRKKKRSRGPCSGPFVGDSSFFSEGYNGAASASTCRERRMCGDIHTSRVQFSFRHMQRCGRSVLAYAQMHSELQTSLSQASSFTPHVKKKNAQSQTGTTHTHTLTLSLSLSVSHTHTHIHTHTHLAHNVMVFQVSSLFLCRVG